MARKTLQQDDINLSTGLYVDRQGFVEAILEELNTKQHVVISSPPARGKTSVLSLLARKLKDENERVFRCLPKRGSEAMLSVIESWGIPTIDATKLKKVERCWIMVDDAQRGYAYDEFWEFLVKDVAVNPNIKVIIAATHDFSTLGSPASLRLLPHVFFNFCESEITELIRRFCFNFEIDFNQHDWIDYWNSVKEMSLIDNGNNQPEFHIGVVLRCMLDLERSWKLPSCVFSGLTAQERLRKQDFLQGFDRCFAINSDTIKDAMLRQGVSDVLLGSLCLDAFPEHLLPMVRAGVLTLQGTFTCQAAHWFYNTVHFPNRALALPNSLEELIEGAVQLLSAARLRSCVQDGHFPVETSFQHLFNEAFTAMLPTMASVKPEYRTKAPGFLGDDKKGFIDFYINDSIQWAVELLVLGRGLTEHRKRFHHLTGKYRTLPTKKHLVVDIRGPRETGVEKARQDLCVLYFSNDWAGCEIQMEHATIKQVRTQL